MTDTKSVSPRPHVYGSVSAVRLEGVGHFDVSKVFDCGQSFRFERVTDSPHSAEFAGCAFGKYISVACDEDSVYIYNTDVEEYKRIWKRYLGLDLDYDEINRSILSLTENQALRDAVSKADGIRILRQEAWETVCSFIISQNNNIPRIKKLIFSLCLACGDPIDVSLMEGHIATAHKESGGHFYSFPTPEKVLDLGVRGLTELKMGFRAKYLIDAAQKMLDGTVNPAFLESSDTACGIQHLSAIKGVGPKVASCALLFGFGKLDAFPVDVWIRKAIAKYFDPDFDPANLGEYAGIAQQYLFYYERYLQQNQ